MNIKGVGLYQPLDLNIAKCKMMVACRKDFNYEENVKKGMRLRVASKYINGAAKTLC